jgi:signal peptidase I
MALVKAIWGTALVLFLILVGGLLAFGIAPLVTSHDPSRPAFVGGYAPIVVLGGSMEPTYHIGSILFVRRVNPESVHVGNVITFASPSNVAGREGTLTTHRVVSIDRSSGQPVFRTKGDANSSDDDWSVPADTVVGQGVFTVPYVGYFSNFVRSRTGFLALVIGPGILFVILEILSIVRQLKESKASRQQPVKRALPVRPAPQGFGRVESSRHHSAPEVR